MSQSALAEVFTPDEVARAAGATLADVHAALDTGEIRTITGTTFIGGSDAIRLGRRLKAAGRRAPAPRKFVGAACASSAVHAVLVAAAVWCSAGTAQMEAIDEPPPSPTRLVFIMAPGPGGGGGGGGLRNLLPPARAERRAPDRPRAPRVSVPEAVKAVAPAPTSPPPAPEPAPQVTAPVVPAAADDREQKGIIDRGTEIATSQGPGTNGGAGTGQGTGSGEGAGSGIGEGRGGGTGGGPYRPGAGIEPPRLLHEVKAVYTEDARRRGLTGDVLLEIVVRRDGSVGEVTVIRALGAGLEARAIEAVRQWRFAPARRYGTPVDVIVEVAVEFTLR
ncbi:MAG: energy transducer TonB [Acidobacteria bacterium]|nr:energy transducer TonB [Acidobacteriota bacterium]